MLWMSAVIFMMDCNSLYRRFWFSIQWNSSALELLPLLILGYSVLKPLIILLIPQYYTSGILHLILSWLTCLLWSQLDRQRKLFIYYQVRNFSFLFLRNYLSLIYSIIIDSLHPRISDHKLKCNISAPPDFWQY